MTRGYRLKARHVIHAVGPIWQGGGFHEEQLLAAAYTNALALAEAHGLHSVAFPAISTGIYGFPMDAAARIAVTSLSAALVGMTSVSRVILCCFGAASLASHRAALAALRAQRG